ncbi:unnamed protein product, partial [Tenebrio molitor]
GRLEWHCLFARGIILVLRDCLLLYTASIEGQPSLFYSFGGSGDRGVRRSMGIAANNKWSD